MLVLWRRTESVSGAEVLAVGPAGAAEGPAVAVPDVVGGGCVGDDDAAAAGNGGERHGADGSPCACTASSLSHLGISRTHSSAGSLHSRGEMPAPASWWWLNGLGERQCGTSEMQIGWQGECSALGKE